MGRYIYMKVTKDEYELPIAVADDAYQLADVCGTTPNNIYSSISHGRKSYKRVYDEEHQKEKNKKVETPKQVLKRYGYLTKEKERNVVLVKNEECIFLECNICRVTINETCEGCRFFKNRNEWERAELGVIRRQEKGENEKNDNKRSI